MSIYPYLYTHTYICGIEWIKRCVYICVCVYIYSYAYNGILAIKKKETMPFASIWMDVEMIILGEGSQERKTNIK